MRVKQTCTPFAPGVGIIWGIYDTVIFADVITVSAQNNVTREPDID